MRVQNAPRYQGKIASWKDEQGFGFIAPNGGGPTVFVHIKSFSRKGARPRVDDVVTYLLGANEKGQPRADSVAFVRSPGPRSTPPRPGGAMLLTAAVFMASLAAAAVAGKVPLLLLGLYGLASVITFSAYAGDKVAAEKGQRRTPEDTLHMFALIGGWPGAMAAQQMLRHKTQKASFRSVFWCTVLMNIAALCWFISSAGPAWLKGLRFMI